MPACPHDSPVVRLACLTAGFIALGLGVVGIFLPLLPTTPFLLLAAACFARGSAKLHGWMLAHPVAGPVIREWEEHRAMPRRAKRWAYGLLLVSFAFSIFWMDSPWHRLLLAGLGLVLGFFLWRVPVRG